MAEKIEGWNPTCNRFVAFLDIMGFRYRVFRDTHEEVKVMLESLRPIIESLEKEARKILGEKEKYGTTKFTHAPLFPVSFSDSIILFSSDDSDFSAIYTIINAASILSDAIKNGIPMKGAIAYGEVTAALDKSLYFGKPLIDAYDLHKELQIYGLVLHHTVQKRFEELKREDIERALAYKYPVPMKSGKINHHIIDWTFLLDTEINPKDLVSKLYKNVSGHPRLYVDNTIEFLEWLEKEQAKKQKEKKP